MCGVSLILNAWSRYPMGELLNLRINAWSLDLIYPCRVCTPKGYRRGIKLVEINAWSREWDSKHNSSNFRPDESTSTDWSTKEQEEKLEQKINPKNW